MREIVGQALATAATIAISESINEGRNYGFDDIIDDIRYMMWSALLDDRTCPICLELDGKIFEKDDPVLNKIDPPIHVNCRCMLVATMKDEVQTVPEKYTYLSAAQVEEYTKNKFF